MKERQEFETKYPHRSSRYLAWCWLEDRNPCLSWGGCENNLSFMEWVNRCQTDSPWELSNSDYWNIARRQKGELCTI